MENKRMEVRVKAWSDRKLLRECVAVGDQKVELDQFANSAVWRTTLYTDRLPSGVSLLTAHFADGRRHHPSGYESSPGQYKPATRIAADKNNEIGAWPEHGILGTQLGPNKNGRKW
jgi:3',5'-cyclic-AMP phosphodiesterase